MTDSSINLTVPSSAQAGNTVSVAATIQNVDSVSHSFECRVVQGGITILDQTQTISPGAQHTFTCSFTMPSTSTLVQCQVLVQGSGTAYFNDNAASQTVTTGGGSGSTYTVTCTVQGPGNISISPSSQPYAPGASVTLTATPSSGATFNGWYQNSTLISSSPSYTISNIQTNWVLTATFAISSGLPATVQTSDASTITTNGAILSGYVSAFDTLNPGYVIIGYGKTNKVGTANWDYWTGWSSVIHLGYYDFPITGLDPDSTYYFEIIGGVDTSAVYSYGGGKSFKTTKLSNTPVATYRGISIYQSTSGSYSGMYYVNQISGYWSTLANVETFIDNNPATFGLGTPSITVTPNVLTSGTETLSVAVQGFSGNAQLTISITPGTFVSNSPVTGSNGSIAAIGIQISGYADGTYTITVRDSIHITTTTFTIKTPSVTVTPSPIATGGTISVAVQGFSASTLLTIGITSPRGTPISINNISTDPSGNITFPVVLTNYAIGVTYTISVYDSKTTKTATFNVIASQTVYSGLVITSITG